VVLFKITDNLQLVIKSVKRWDLWHETLSCPDTLNDLLRLRALVKRAGWKDLPMVKDALWKGLTAGSRPQMSDETKRFIDWQVSFDSKHWCPGDLRFLVDVTSPLVEDTVDTTDGGLWALDLALVDGFEEPWLGGELTGVEDSSGGWHDLTGTSMDGVSVKGDVVDVESAATHVFVGEDTLFGSPLKTTDNAILDLVQVLHTLSDLANHVRTADIWAKAPNLPGIVRVHLKFLLKILGPLLSFLLMGNFTVLDLISQTVWEGVTFHVKPVMLVW